MQRIRSGRGLNLALTVFILVSILLIGAASPIVIEAKTQVSIPGTPGVSIQHTQINFSELARQEAANPPPTPQAPIAVPDAPLPPKKLGAGNGKFQPLTGSKTAEDVSIPAPSAPPTLGTNFQGFVDDIVSIPPDTHGTVGPNHVLTTLNSRVVIQSRAGAAISSVTLKNFWASLGNPATFDPKSLYDPFNNRYLFTAVADGRSANSSVLMAVSQTNDPTGIWNLYKIDADSTDTNWADYPSFGFNKNWIVVSLNMFSVAASSFSGVNIYAFNKSDLYSDGTGLYSLLQDNSRDGFTITPMISYDNTVDTMYMLEDFDNTIAQLRMSTITGTVNSPVLNLGVSSPTSSLGAWAFGGGADFAPQLSSAQKIQTSDSRIQNVVYRNGAIWAAHTIFLPAGGRTRSSIQWWQLTTAGAITQNARIDDANSVNFYAFPSIMVNKNNDVLIGYACFSAQIFGSACYSFRSASDTANTMQGPFTLKSGEATYYKTYSGTRNRWGDYSNTVVDPVNDTDFWTVQEYAYTPTTIGATTYDRFAIWWGQINPPAPASLVVSVSADSGAGSLRTAITNANTQVATQSVSITFSVSTVTVDSPLPTLNNSTGNTYTVDGSCTTDANGRGVPGVNINRGAAFSGVGLNLNSKITLKGLAITGFSDYGLDITGSNNQISCNWLGTANGTSAIANGGGIRIAGSTNTLGAAGQANMGNLFSGNGGSGILVNSGINNLSYYSWVGLQKDGITALRNSGTAVRIVAGGQLKFGIGNRVR